MGILSSLERRQGASLEDPNTPLSDGFTLLETLGGGRPTSAGLSVSQDNVISISGVWAALQMICGTIGVLPLKMYQEGAGGRKDEVRQHPLWGRLNLNPNADWYSSAFRESKQVQLLLAGSGFTEIERNGAGEVENLWPIPVNRARWAKFKGRRYLVVIDDEGGVEALTADQVWWLRGIGTGLTGWETYKVGRESFALSMAMEQHGAAFFGKGSIPSGVLEYPESLSAEGAERLRKEFERNNSGLSNRFRAMLLEDGLTWHQLGLSAEESQLDESRKFQIEEVARWFNIQPNKLKHLDRSTFNNVEQENISYVVDTIQPWLTRWEQSASMMLLTERERRQGLFLEFVVDGLLRGDVEKRTAAYNVRFNTGSMSPNEIRAKENQNPIPGGDQYFVPLNMVPLGKAEAMSVDERARLLAAANGGGKIETRRHKALPSGESRSQAERIRLPTAFLPLFQDAAGRMVRGELRNLRRNVDLLSDGPQAFIAFLEQYYFQEHPAFARSVMGPVFGSYAEAMAAPAAREINADEVPADIDLFVDQYLSTFVDRYSASSRRQLAELAREAEAPQEAVEQRFQEWDEGSDEGRPRAERLAQREVHQLGNATAKAVWAAGGILSLTWRTVSESCPYCTALHGRTVGIRESFIGANQPFQPDGASRPIVNRFDVGHPPAHPGCDCLISPGA